MSPQVTVICTCYNHERFVAESIHSVLSQTYRDVQLIIIDNSSTDGSDELIQEIVAKYPAITYLRNITNVGLCRAFNQGLEHTTGEYVIDLAADDIMTPDRIEKQVAAFLTLPREYAVVFSNAIYVDERGHTIGYHYATDTAGQVRSRVPSGEIYKEVLRRYFICTPTIMMRKSALMKLGGYDETLAYEDFDFFVRSANYYKYHYIDEILMQKRIVQGSLATQFYKVGNPLLKSSWEVCNKAYDLNRSQEEYNILAYRIREFIKKCFVAEDAEQAVRFRKLLNYIEEPGWQTDALVLLCQLHFPANWAYQRYARWRNHRNLILMQQGVPFVQLAAE
jgi:glycosyltransferase involved in cell wall biosynthesis